VSPWHEIPLYAGDGLLHYICEIPKETSAKMEVATVSEPMQATAQLDLLQCLMLTPIPSLTHLPPTMHAAG
jgi:hypothetical protein